MLRDGGDETAAWRQGRMNCSQDGIIVIDVLEHIICADQIKGIACGYPARVHLDEESAILEPYSCMLETGGMKLGAREACPWAGARESIEHESRPTSDLHVVRGGWKVSFGETEQQEIARLEPVIAGLLLHEPFE